MDIYTRFLNIDYTLLWLIKTATVRTDTSILKITSFYSHIWLLIGKQKLYLLLFVNMI